MDSVDVMLLITVVALFFLNIITFAFLWQFFKWVRYLNDRIVDLEIRNL